MKRYTRLISMLGTRVCTSGHVTSAEPGGAGPLPCLRLPIDWLQGQQIHTYIETGKIVSTKGRDRSREKEFAAYAQGSSFLKMKTPPRKVVLDSDDEEESSPRPLPTKGFIPNNKDISHPTSNPPHPSEDPSTGSTGSSTFSSSVAGD